MKKNLLVTIADKNYLDQAKQLFSSVYINAGWQGDYMILFPSEDKNYPGLEWFRSKGILIKELPALYQGQAGGMEAIRTIKFHLFTPEFKKWEHILYVDVDLLIRASLDELNKVKGFAAVMEKGTGDLSAHFISQKNLDEKSLDLFKQLKEKYNLNIPIFNTGIFVINTNLISSNSFDELNQLFSKYQDVIVGSDQTALNLFFYKNWQKLPPIYNSMYITGCLNLWPKQERIKGIIIHFPGKDKPWLKNNYFYQEWKNNLDKADKIDLKNIPISKRWSRWQVISYTSYLNLRYKIIRFYYIIDNKIGQLGVLLKKYSPRLYKALKKILDN